MKYTTFNQKMTDTMKEPMFFGDPVNVARYDQQKHPIFEKLIEKQISFFWRPEEVDVSKDRVDFQKLTEAEKHIFTSNLKYQTLLDSVQGRSPNIAFLPIISLPELETWVETLFRQVISQKNRVSECEAEILGPKGASEVMVTLPKDGFLITISRTYLNMVNSENGLSTNTPVQLNKAA